MAWWNPMDWIPDIPPPWKWPEVIYDGLTGVGKAAVDGIQDAWGFTEDEAVDLYNAMGEAGKWTNDNIIKQTTDGIEEGAKLFVEGAELTGKGLVNAGVYVSNHLCSIGLGAALSGAFAAWAATGEEEATFSSIAALCSTKAVDEAALNTVAIEASYVIVEPIYVIPGVESAIGGKKTVEALIAFIIVKAATQNPEKVALSLGQIIPGLLIYGITTAVCEGKFPGGFEVWKGAQPEFQTL